MHLSSFDFSRNTNHKVITESVKSVYDSNNVCLLFNRRNRKYQFSNGVATYMRNSSATFHGIKLSLIILQYVV